MPRIGTPASSRPAGAGGAPGAYTDAGPPDRMIAAGLLASSSRGGHGGRHDLGVHLALAHPARDQLGVLGPEVDDQDRSGAPGRGPRPGSHGTAFRRVASVGAAPVSGAGQVLVGCARSLLGLVRPAVSAWPARRPRQARLTTRTRAIRRPSISVTVSRRPATSTVSPLGGQVPEHGQHVAGHRLVRPVRQLDAGLLGELVQVQQAVHLDARRRAAARAGARPARRTRPGCRRSAPRRGLPA